jgi:hypothetical protein
MPYDISGLQDTISSKTGQCDRAIVIPSPLAPGMVTYVGCDIDGVPTILSIYDDPAARERAVRQSSPYVYVVYGPNWSVQTETSEHAALTVLRAVGGTLVRPSETFSTPTTS